MVIVNTETKLVHENANFTQAGIIIGVDGRTVSRWKRKYVDVKQYKKWHLYFKVIKLKKGILEKEW